MKIIFVLCALGILTGCATPTHVEIQQVKVPVPIACQEPTPPRPVMPTEHLPLGAGLDPFVQAAQAEIERREGYEGQLRAALEACAYSHDGNTKP